ncbi:MAG: ExbD/TolR family protein [Alphaproteobacteria bacterium]
MRLRRTQSAVTVLNITPMIDVVFILLVFFMLATNFANFRLIRIETPEETKVVDKADAAIVILLKADGTTTFDAEPIRKGTLAEAIAGVLAIDPGRTFLIRPEPGVSLQRAIDAFGTARLAGARALAFSPPRNEGAAP